MLEMYFKNSSIVLVDPSLFSVWMMFEESLNQQYLHGDKQIDN